MFSLENEIKNWKKQLRKYQSVEDGYADELEQHLRDEIDKLTSEGFSVEEAFNLAASKVGNAEEISEEFYREKPERSSKRPPWKENPYLPSLLNHYFRIGFRQLARNKGYTFINIFGLAVGLACVLFLTLFIQFERSYDGYNVNKDRLYRAYLQIDENGEEFNMAPLWLPFAPAIKAEMPEVETAVRISWNYELVRYKNKSFFEEIRYTDADLFDVFSYELLEGNVKSMLDAPDKIIISDEMAEKYFGKEDAVGKVLQMKSENDYLVTGVFKKLPVNSSYQSDFFASISSLEKQGNEQMNSWDHLSNDYTFILLKEGISPGDVEKKFPELLLSHMDKERADQYKIILEKITDVHFSTINYDQARTISSGYLYVFGSIALFILAIACINFINLSTARASRRNREVGIRKSIGAQKSELIGQFISEALVYVAAAFIIALGIIYLLLPEANQMFRSSTQFSDIFRGENLILLFIIFLLTGLLSGGYPAFYLSRVKPVVALKSESGRSTTKNRLREILVIVQFAISAFLIIGTTTIHEQIDYMVNQDLGFDSDEVAVIPLHNKDVMSNPEPFRNKLLALPGIAGVSFSSGTPASGYTQSGGVTSDGPEDPVSCQYLYVDDKFFDTYGIKFIKGRSLNKEYSTDLTDAVVINEKLWKSFGWDDPVGKKISSKDGVEGTVIGVVENFNYSSVKEDVESNVFKYRQNDLRFCTVKFDKSAKNNIMDRIEKAYNEVMEGYPFEGYLMKEQFLRFYRNETRIGNLITIFASIAILISCLGILGLISFMTEQKRKEIGIRKVLGASITSVLQILGKQFVKWVILANLIVIPLAYYVLENWLSDFAVRISMTVFPFIIAAGVSIALALLTVGYHVIKAALSNPIEALKYE